MYQQERLNEIMDLIKKNNYLTVRFLVNELHYSNATINRDLNILEKRKLIKRSYGGAELTEPKEIPITFRYHKMKAVKNKIAKAAAEYVNDGDVIFIDGSTTTQFMCNYLLNKKDITVITNNIFLVSFFSENNIKVICLGGEIVEMPYMLSGSLTVENAAYYKIDKAFFSSGAVGEKGEILGLETYFLLIKTIFTNTKKRFLLDDHTKLNLDFPIVFAKFDEISHVICDFDFPDETKKKYKNVEYINVSDEKC